MVYSTAMVQNLSPHPGDHEDRVQDNCSR